MTSTLTAGLDWLVNAGGGVVARAVHGPAWRVAVEDPRDRTKVLCVVPLRDGAVVTSGTAARGRHITDPRTGAPAADHLLSATVIGPPLTWADVLATAAFVEGPAALPRIEGLDGCEALLVRPDGRLLATPGALAAPPPAQTGCTGGAQPGRVIRQNGCPDGSA